MKFEKKLIGEIIYWGSLICALLFAMYMAIVCYPEKVV